MKDLLVYFCGVLIAAKWAAQMALEWANQHHVQSHAGAVPAAFAETVSPETYAKSVDYTLAKSRLQMIEMTWSAAVLAGLLFSGVLPWFYRVFTGWGGASVWSGAGFLLAVGMGLSVLDLPFEWHGQFHLEERFGFNTTTPGLWWLDRVKGLGLALVLGLPLLALILQLAGRLGTWWWVWAWGCLAVFQLVMMVAAPVLIMPLFNKFTPLPEGGLRDGLLELGRRAGFRARDIQVMDGSKRSRHSNAFFTGLGRFRKIVLFDTLLRQLDPAELESVLAHEIGHYKKGHVPKMIALSLGGRAGGVLSDLRAGAGGLVPARLWLRPGEMAPALLLFSLLSGLATFWVSPLFHGLSRRHEYEADAFAAGLVKQNGPLITALRKLNEKNLSNLTPHPLYSGFYYSHPTLLERERKLKAEG